MANTLGRTKVKGDLIGNHQLDPDGDVVLVFSSKYAVVSGPLEVDLVNAEDWNAIGEAQAEGTPNKKESVKDEISNKPELDIRPVYELGVNDIKLRVSSQILALASPIFKAMFSRNFREGSSLHHCSSVVVSLPSDSPQGIITILRLLHLQYDITNITPSLMMQIAWAADKYDVAKPIKFWSRKWFEEIKRHVPRKWIPEVVTWLGMFRMLKFEEEEFQMEKLARGHISDTTSCGQLPIDGLINFHKHNTTTTLRETLGKLDDLVTSCWDPEKQICVRGHPGCSSMILGCLLKGLKAIQLYPVPRIPVHGATLLGLATNLRNMSISTCSNNQWARPSCGHGSNLFTPGGSCSYGCKTCKLSSLIELAEGLEQAAAKSYKDSIKSDSRS